MSTGEYGRNEELGRLLAGRYRVLARLGRGGMGVVWRAMDEVLGREVAVKELRTYTDAGGPELADLRLRMQREARAAARIKHPGVVAVHDVADEGGRPVIVMELIDGPSLDDVLTERGVMDPREAARIGARVMEALGAAHRAGVLHRDVKPGNVLLDPSGRVVLTDFGIAAMDDPGDGSTTHLTRSGELVGSLDYLAPERAQGQEPGPASDVWALGATLYAAVEGNSPFRRTSTWSTLTAIVADPLPEARRAGPLGPVLEQLMHKDPALRPDAETAARLLAAVAGDGGVTTAPIGLGGAVPGAGPAAGPGHAPRVPTEINRTPHRPEGFGPRTAGPPPYGAPQQAPPAGQFGPPGPAPSAGPAASGGPSVTSRHRAVPGDGTGTGGRSRKKSRMLIAAGVAAVLLAGGGVTYALVDRGGSAAEEDVAGGGPENPGKGPGGQVLDPGGATPEDSSPSAKPKEQGDKKPKPPKDGTKPPAPGGGTGGSDSGGKGDGASTGGGSGSGGSTGGDGGSGGGGSNSGGGGGSDPAPEPVCHPIGGGKYNCQVWRQANSYTADGSQVGVLNEGTNYFYCQQNLGRRETSGQWTNIWWAKTDDDSGNTNVFVSDVYISGGDNDQPLPGLPVC